MTLARSVLAVLVIVGGVASCGDDLSEAPSATPPADAAPPGDASADASSDAPVGDAPLDAAMVHRDLGVTFSPVGFGGPVDGWLGTRDAFYAARAAHGRIVAYHVGYRDEVAPRPACGQLPGISALLDTDTVAHSFTLSLVLGWSAGDGTPDLGCEPAVGDNSWSNPTTRASYKSVAVALATRYHPRYLFLGNEVNTWYLTHVADWPQWLSELTDVAQAVRIASPSTLVGTVYQWEHLRGGGKRNGWTDPPQWSLLADVVGKVDILGITSYPFFDHDTPDAIPADYYGELLARFPGPLGFTEIGWKAEAAPPYPGGESDQARAPAAVLDKVPAERLRYATWVFLNDPVTDLGPFATSGLRSSAGTARPVDAAWRAAVAARQSPP
jgi:hypothetical protein